MTGEVVETRLQITREDAIALAGLTLLWLIPLSVIGVEGPFALNDDWAYARATRALIETGLIERTSWTWTPVISHSALGAAFAALFGFSFETLRCVGVFMGWVGVIGAFALARQLGAGVAPSALVAATLGLNPVYINIAYTYMTDVPFTAICILSLLLLARGIERSAWVLVLGGAVLAWAAMTTRQAGLAAPLAFAAALIVSRPTRWRSWVIGALACVIVVLGYMAILEVAYGPGDAGRIFSTKNFASVGIAQDPVHRVAVGAISSLAYYGVFLAPVALIAISLRGRTRNLVGLGAVAFAGLALLAVVRLDMPMPPGLNVVYNLGLGPGTLGWEGDLPGAPSFIWWIGTGFGFAVSFCILAAVVLGVWPRVRDVLDRPAWLLTVAFSVIYLGPHLMRAPYFDRYMLPTLAPLGAALLLLAVRERPPGRLQWTAACVVLLALGLFGTVGTRDYLERHRVRTALLVDLVESGVSPQRIEGGLEFNGWHSFERYWGGERYHWKYVNDDEYTLSYASEISGYTLVDERTYGHWLPPRSETIRVFQRDPSADAERDAPPSAEAKDELPAS